MDKQRQLELVRERNRTLEQTVQDLKDQIEFDKNYNSNSLQKAKDLIIELENIKVEWTEKIKELDEKRKQYEELMEETKKLRSLIDEEMEHRGIPRRRRRQIYRSIDKDKKKQEKEIEKEIAKELKDNEN